MGLIRCIGCRAWVRSNVVRCGLCGVTVRRSKRAMDEAAGEAGGKDGGEEERTEEGR